MTRPGMHASLLELSVTGESKPYIREHFIIHYSEFSGFRSDCADSLFSFLEIVCGDPGDIQHGTRNHKGFERGKRVKYKCSPGFTMQGRGTLICRRSGQWDRKKPDCTCARTNTKSFRYCQSACDPNRNKCKGNRQCICDGDCGYSCVPKGTFHRYPRVP